MEIIKFNNLNVSKIYNYLLGGKIVVLPSDTLYGLSCSALNSSSVERIYTLKQRESFKPFIILISEISDLQNFGISLNEYQSNFLKSHWPASLTVVFDVTKEKFEYLHRGTKSLGFRIPDNKILIEIIKKVGPITSTTVNISGQPSAKTIEQATNIFGSKVDLYVENGVMESEPSTVIKLNESSFELLRQGKILL